VDVPDQVEPDFAPTERRSADPGRLVAFSDGVFAIIITILVLDIRVPDFGSDQSVSQSLEELRPTFVAFVISFLLVGMYWIWHRGVFSQVRYVDLNATWLNLLFLLPVSLIPFAASALGTHQSEPTVLQLYGTVLIAATLMRSLLDWYLHRHPGLLWKIPSTQTRRLGAAAAMAPVVPYGIAMAIADVLPGLSLLVFLLAPGVYFVGVVVLKTDPRTRVSSEGLS
jgi:uncharacterized membrane protein